MEYPFLRRRDRGDGAGRAEIVFSEDHTMSEAQQLATRMAAQLGLKVTGRAEGPYCWFWDAEGEGGVFRFGYDDFPCETTLWAANPESDAAIERLFNRLVDGPGNP